MLVVSEKKCLACDKPIRGRSDKKFCNDACRNSYNNQHKAVTPDVIRRINAVLLKNRNILKKLIRGGTRNRVSREQLAISGFVFTHHTHTYMNKKGGTYYFCYDFGWLELTDAILVVESSFN